MEWGYQCFYCCLCYFSLIRAYLMNNSMPCTSLSNSGWLFSYDIVEIYPPVGTLMASTHLSKRGILLLTWAAETANRCGLITFRPYQHKRIINPFTFFPLDKKMTTSHHCGMIKAYKQSCITAYKKRVFISGSLV